MNKNDVKNLVTENMGLTKKDTGDIIDNIIEVIVQGLIEDKKVTIVNFGSFKIIRQEPRKARNPRTGEEIYVPAKQVVKFKPALALKDFIDE